MASCLVKSRLMLTWLFLVLGSTSIKAIEFPVPLSPEEAECDRLQLERLALRMVVSEFDTPDTEARNPSLFLWRRPFGGASYSGLGVTDSVRRDRLGRPIRDERQLSIELTLGEVGDLLDPRRPLLPHATLTRRSQDSNLVVPAQEPSLTVTMEAGVQVIDPSLPRIPLVVNSFRAAGQGRQPLPASDAVGRGLLTDGLTRPCHAKLTAFDERIFRILSRTLRISFWFTLRGPSPSDPTAWNVVLFRGENPHLYRGTIMGYVKTCNDDGTCPFGRLVPAGLEFEVHWDDQGKLTDGQVRLIPQPSSDLMSMFLLPPMRPGRDRQGEESFVGAPFLRFDFPDAPGNILTAPVDWEDLLEDSAWND